MIKINLNRLLIGASFITFLIFIYSVVWWNKEIDINGQEEPVVQEELRSGPKSSLTGLACNKYNRRPIAVMLASDREARPLSGLSQADMVFEMPVTPDGITRLMALYQCELPEAIGSVRSARQDFIPLAASFNAIYAHWGGERDALNNLDNHIIDNIDALKYEGFVFYRVKWAKPPHNGFTDLDRILAKSKELNYSITNTFSGYAHTDSEKLRNISNLANTISVDYPSDFSVQWQYDPINKIYLRSRHNSPEIDKNTNSQVSSSVIIVMETTSKFLRDQYIQIKVAGQGDAKIYQRGAVIDGMWHKDPSVLGSKLYFTDESGKEIKLVPGKIWVEIITPQS